jgi:hypothetical protein
LKTIYSGERKVCTLVVHPSSWSMSASALSSPLVSQHDGFVNEGEADQITAGFV